MPHKYCSTGGNGERTTTIGQERAANPLLGDAPDEDTFVARLLGGLGSYPRYFAELRADNRAGPALYGADPPPPLIKLGIINMGVSIPTAKLIAMRD